MSTSVPIDTAVSEAREDQARAIGRGALYLTLTKLWFIAGSYLIYLLIPYFGGANSTVLLGDYKAVGAWLSVISTVLVQGTTQAVARFIGAEPGGWRAIVARGLRIQFVLGAIVAGAYFLAASWIAGEKDSHLVTPLRISAVIPFVYAMYAVLLGTLNGRRRYAEQALVDGSFTTLKVLLNVGGIVIAGTVAAAYLGFAVTAVLIFVMAAVIVHRGNGETGPRAGAVPSVREILRFQFQTVGFMAAVQWAVQMDLWYVKKWSILPEAAADTAAGLYAGAQLLAQISYSAMIAVTLVLFPLISGSSLQQDRTAARNYVREALRYGLILICTVAIPVSASPRAALRLLLPKLETDLASVPGAEESLRWLALGYVAFGLFYLLCSVLNAAGRPRVSIILGILVVGLQGAIGWFLVPTLGLAGQGIAGLLAMAVGLIAALAVVGRYFGSVLPGATVARVGVSGAVAYALALLWQPTGLAGGIACLASSGAIFIVGLAALREFTAADRQRFLRVLPGSRRP